MNNYRLKKLVIKPTLKCTANCPTCAGRKELHKDSRSSRMLTFDDWKRILKEAYDLGTETLDISGGEPTLYKQLPDLIEIGRSYDWPININSNGSLMTEELAETLLKAGANSIHISLYSPVPEIHDRMRRAKGLWKKATQAIMTLSSLQDKYPDFRVNTQTLICRENYRDLAELIALHYKLGSNRIALSYLEGDYDGEHLLNRTEIDYLKHNVIPGAIAFTQSLDKSIRDEATNTVKNLFSEEILSIENWTRGKYRPRDPSFKRCKRPSEFTILLANGDVHPCNIVEYTHEPVMGNLHKNSLTEIWHNEKWNTFRKDQFSKCELCPINLYMSIPLRAADSSPKKGFKSFLSSIIKPETK